MAVYLDTEAGYQKQVEAIQEQCLDYPMFVTVETLALCNAACEFCPYPSMERKGDRMSDELFEKIIHDLKDIPPSHSFSMHLSRVNEPFLDNRIFDFYRLVNRSLPQAKVAFFSNASVLTEAKTAQLSDITNVEFFILSFNDHRKDEYERVMQIPYERSVKHITALHERKQAGELDFPILISRVGDNTPADQEFIEWCESRFPDFIVTVRPRGDWIGMTSPKDFPVPKAGCKQWFQLHILADGRDAFCCIDAEGKFGYKQNAQFQHVLDIYNLPERRAIRANARYRQEVEICTNCTMYS